MSNLDAIAQADMATDERAEALWKFLNRMIRAELGTERPPPAADDLAAHLRFCLGVPDDEYRQAVADTHERALGLVERLQETDRGRLSIRSGSLAGDLWSAVLTLTQADREKDNAARIQALAGIMELETLPVAAGLRPWVPVLKPLLVHWYIHGATLVHVNHHPYPLLPHAATVSHLPELVMEGRALPVRAGQAMLPGFEGAGNPIRQSVLVEVLDLGTGGRGLQGGRGAPLAARTWIACMLAAPRASWDYPARVRVTVREFLTRLYLPDTWPTGVKLTNQLERLQDEVFRVRMIAPGGRIRPVAIDWIPIDNRTGYVKYDEPMEFQVRLPPGMQQTGVPVDFLQLRLAGMRSGPGYRALLNLYYTWHEHNRSLRKTSTGHWLQSHNPEDYAWFSGQQQIALAFPRQVITGRTHGHLLERAQKTWHKLGQLGAIQLIKSKADDSVKLLPPPSFRRRPPTASEPN